MGILVAIAIALVSQRAQACGSGGGPFGLAGLAIGGGVIGGGAMGSAMIANFAFSARDVAKQGKLLRRDGAAEVGTMIPALLIGTATIITGATFQAGQSHFDPLGGSLLVIGSVQSLWSAGLLAHGAYVMSTAPVDERERMAQTVRRTLSVAPTAAVEPHGGRVGLAVSARF
jgi:hypothetical protein